MTPEEILQKHYNSIWDSDNESYINRMDNEAIEAIKQYAREMCEEQKGICNALAILAPEEILNAPYPEELL